MRMVICDGFQYDADSLPPHVDASKCIPADEWFRVNHSAHVPTVEPAKQKRTRSK